MRILKEGSYKNFEYIITEIEIFFDEDEIELISNINKKWVNGYVKIKKEDAKYIKEEISCHGGVTFCDYGTHLGKDNNFYIGFDTNHYFDTEATQNLNYAENECKSIIDQILLLEYKK